MGEVFLAEDMKLGRKVAIKFVAGSSVGDKKARERLMREARAAAALDHPNICAIYEVSEDGDDAFIAMQYVAGETLHNRLRSKSLALREAISVTAQIAEALIEAHTHDIIHRDIKPQNVIITAQGKVKVLDFGLAKVIRANEPADTEARTATLLTEAGFVMGTVPYMSPEQAKGEPVDTRSDIFSLGALLYECVSGRPAFHGSNSIDTAAQVIHVDPAPPSHFAAGLPPDVDRIVHKALAKKVEARYQSGEEMLSDLRRLEGVLDKEQAETVFIKPTSLPSAPDKSPLTGRISGRVNRKSMLVGLALALLLAIAVWASSSFWRGSRHQPSAEANGWYEKGTAALREGAYYQATRMLERAIELDRNFPLAHARLADAYAEVDAVEKAKDELLIATSLVKDRATLSETDATHLDAIAATVRRDFSAAVEFYQKLADQAPDTERSSAQVDLGRSYEKSENINKAVECYSRAAQADPQSATAFLRLGILYGRRQDAGNANGAFEKAEEIYRVMANAEGLAEVFFQRGFVLSKIRKLAEARKQLERALDISRSAGNTYQVVKTQLQLSGVFYAEGDTERAKAVATEAINLAQANNIRNLATNGLIDLGYTLFSRGEFNEAAGYFRQALEFAHSDKARKTEARAKLGLGTVIVQQGNPDEAIALLQEALQFYQPAGYSKETSITLLTLGRAHRNRGEYDIALNIFEEQLQLARELDDPAQIVASHTSMAILLGIEQEKYAEALPHVDESYRINESIGAKVAMGYDLVNRGILLMQLGRYQQAREALGQAFEIANRPEANYKAVLAWVRLANSQMALTERRFAESKAEGRRALDLAGTEYPDVVLQAKHTLGVAQALSGAPHPARVLCEEAVAEARRLNNPRLLSSALLSLAEVMLTGDDAQDALSTALQAQKMFAHAGQHDSEWRSWVIAARASQRTGLTDDTKEYAARAEALCAGLQQKWGAEAYADYLRRPDIQVYRRQVEQLLARGPMK
jgi:serine/threonine protein kinase/lipopolysaccharide biosynthesis regulator YciM